MKRYWKLALAVVCLVAADQLTKYWAYAVLRVEGPVVLIPGVFEFSYLENRGAAFGMLQGKFWLLYTCCALILAGALGNFVDRCLRGFVVDFLYFSLIDFPVFNVADCYVVIGCIGAACVLLFDKDLFDGNPKEEST